MTLHLLLITTHTLKTLYELAATSPQQTTLKHGYSFSERLFVNATQAVDAIVPSLAEALHVALVPRLLLSCNDQLSLKNMTNVGYMLSYTIASDFQLHESTDKRLYAVNFAGLLPCDLPRCEIVCTLVHTYVHFVCLVFETVHVFI